MTGVARPWSGGIDPAAMGGVLVQHAWVTNDLDQAIPLLGRGLGLSGFERVDDRRLTVATPRGKRELRQNLAFARSGAITIELVEPIGDDEGFWSAELPTDRFAIRPHHMSVRIDGPQSAWDDYRGRIGLMAPVPVEGMFGKAHFLFADLRDILGVYLEAVWRASWRERR